MPGRRRRECDCSCRGVCPDPEPTLRFEYQYGLPSAPWYAIPLAYTGSLDAWIGSYVYPTPLTGQCCASCPCVFSTEPGGAGFFVAVKRKRETREFWVHYAVYYCTLAFSGSHPPACNGVFPPGWVATEQYRPLEISPYLVPGTNPFTDVGVAGFLMAYRAATCVTSTTYVADVIGSVTYRPPSALPLIPNTRLRNW